MEVFLGLTVLCEAGYKLFGMTWFKAICDRFSTVSIGGIAIHDASLAAYLSLGIPIIAMAVMLLSATSFSLHFVALQQQSLGVIFRDSEVRAFLAINMIWRFLAIIASSMTSCCVAFLLL